MSATMDPLENLEKLKKQLTAVYDRIKAGGAPDI